MKIVNQESEVRLFEKIETLRYQPHESWRAAYFKLADKHHTHEQKKQSIEFITSTIGNSLKEINGGIYLLANGDVFMLFQGSLKTIENTFHSYFRYLAPKHLKLWPADSILFTFDLRKDWERFYAICESNYLNALAKTEEMRTQYIYVAQPQALSHRL